MRYFTLYILFGFIHYQSTAQFTIDTLQNKNASYLHRWQGGPFSQSENSIGLVPSIQGFQHLFLGLDVGKGWFLAGEGGGSAFIASLGVMYNPIQQIVAPNFRATMHGFAFFFGANTGIQLLYYMNGTDAQWVLKPEIGIGLLKGFLNYGYHIPTKNDMVGTPRHSLTFSFYFTCLHRK